jgi:alpha-glucuronidase
MTLTHDLKGRDCSGDAESHEAVVDYMTPLGLHHLFWGEHHYGPAPGGTLKNVMTGTRFIITGRC